MGRVVVLFVPRPNVDLLAKVLNHFLDRVVVVVIVVARHAAAAALLRHRVRAVLAQALYEARVVKAVPVVGMPVHAGRVFVHRVGRMTLEDGTPIPVRQNRRQFLLLIRSRVCKIQMIRFVLVDVVKVVWEILVVAIAASRRRRSIIVVQRTAAGLKSKFDHQD